MDAISELVFNKDRMSKNAKIPLDSTRPVAYRWRQWLRWGLRVGK